MKRLLATLAVVALVIPAPVLATPPNIRVAGVEVVPQSSAPFLSSHVGLWVRASDSTLFLHLSNGSNTTISTGGTVTSVVCGTGLTGGTITTSGTCAVSYGSSAGTAVQGNDSRLAPAPGTQGSILYDSGSAWVALGPGTSGQFLKTFGAGQNPSWGSVSVTGGSWMYGTGNDSACVFDGITTPVCGATLSGSTYTVNRDIHATTITIASNVLVYGGGNRILATTSITFSGTGAAIEMDGSVGTGAAWVNGSNLGQGSQHHFCGSANCGTGGGNGSTGGGNGGGGTALSNTIGGKGGDGGSGCTFTGGAAGTTSTPISGVNTDSIYDVWNLYRGWWVNTSGSTLYATGGSGGGGGAAGASAFGGGGSGGGGYLVVASPTITVPAGNRISVNGGDGRAGANNGGGTCASGGGGGGGGVLLIVYGPSTSTFPFTASNANCVTNWAHGGAAGALYGTGSAGNAGSNGVCVMQAN